MANQLQIVIYEGYLGAEPEMRYTPAGKSVTNFRMGSSRKYKNPQGEEIKETTWLKVVAWGKLGEIVNQYCGTGSQVIVTGRLRPDPNTGSPAIYDTKSGGHGAAFEVVATDVRILKSKEGAQTEPGNEAPVDDGDIPF